MSSKLSLFGGRGFVLGRYHEMYSDTIVEERSTMRPSVPHVLYGISTVHNYHPIQGDYQIDIETNLTHLCRVLPNVTGSFAHLSSWFIYAGGRPTNAVSGAEEGESGRPLGFYSATKLCSELLVESYCRTNGLPFQILRLCSIIGGDRKAGKQKNAIEYLLGQVVRGEDINLYTGDNYRSILHVDDCCRAIKCVLDNGNPNEIYNVGGPSVRLYDIVQYAMSQTRSRSRLHLVAPPLFHRTIQTDSFWMDTRKLASLGFKPSMTIWESIDRVLAELLRKRGTALDAATPRGLSSP